MALDAFIFVCVAAALSSRRRLSLASVSAQGQELEDLKQQFE